ncbi:MAG: spore cortex biosynthesis protein YabQ [Clostridia bacterium]|nr:spore cortex biosynthesis protein YabQ [Clostridia bacterium]
MPFSITDEVYILLYSCLTGIIIMLFYDILSVTEKEKNCPILIVNICDGIFIIVACAVMAFMTFFVCRGIIRGFEFFGAFIGAVLYKLLLSKFVKLFMSHAIRFILAFFKIFFKILLTPIKFMYKIVNRCILAVFCPIIRMLKKLFSHLFYKIRTSFKTNRKAIKKM